MKIKRELGGIQELQMLLKEATQLADLYERACSKHPNLSLATVYLDALHKVVGVANLVVSNGVVAHAESEKN